MNILCNFEKKKNGNCKFIFENIFEVFYRQSFYSLNWHIFYFKCGFCVGEKFLKRRILR